MLGKHRAGYFSNLPCDWLSIVWVYSEQETENGPCSSHMGPNEPCYWSCVAAFKHWETVCDVSRHPLCRTNEGCLKRYHSHTLSHNWIQNNVNFIIFLSLMHCDLLSRQLTVPPVMRKLSNWQSFVFSHTLTALNKHDINSQWAVDAAKLTHCAHWCHIVLWNLAILSSSSSLLPDYLVQIHYIGPGEHLVSPNCCFQW